jgi:REP element-mobilizing transposase RayT
MPRRSEPLIAGEYYHVYNRGNNRSRVFFENANYGFFLSRLRRYHLGEGSQTSEVFKTSEVYQPASFIAYCLMPSHYHLIAQPHDDSFSHHMQLLTISYTKAINERYKRVGALFQGAFRAKHIDRAEYLLHLSRYIHLNPVRAGLAKRSEDWVYSSYLDYVGLRGGTLPQMTIVLEQLQELRGLQNLSSVEVKGAYREFVESHLPDSDSAVAHLRFDD